MEKISNIIKRVSALLLVCIFIACCFTAAMPASAAGTSQKRVINVVYDDSGSMFGANNDTWCQAKYAMEVFAAMLTKQDVMNIYVMSDYGKKGPYLSLEGSAGTAKNVASVHSMITPGGGTPFASVKKAYTDLVKNKNAEKWLVVLTDGAFDVAVSYPDEYFAKKDDDVKVMFLSIGATTPGITENKGKNIYFERASGNNDILKKITDICTRVFNTHKLEIDISTKKFSFDIPMSELIIFAQGENVSINGIKNSADKLITSSESPVSVRYSEIPYRGAKKGAGKINTSLQGSILTFSEKFAAGEYIAEVENATTIEIYYKPNVEIKAFLTDNEGNEVTKASDLQAGEYKLEFCFVEAGTDKKLASSELLGDVEYEATIKNNGVTDPKKYKSGDTVKLEEGMVEIDVVARYLDYNSVSAELKYDVYANKAITFEAIENPTYTVDTDGFKKTPAIKLKAKIEGQEFTKEQWEAFKLPKVELPRNITSKFGEFKIKKCDETGFVEITPTLKDGKPTPGTYETCKMTVSYEGVYDKESWAGSSEIDFNLKDNRSWLERNWLFLLIVLIILAVIALILWLLFRPVLPKKLFVYYEGELPTSTKIRKQVTINCVDELGAPAVSGKAKVVRRSNNAWIKRKSSAASFALADVSITNISGLRVGGIGYEMSDDGELLNAATHTPESSIEFYSGCPISWYESSTDPMTGDQINQLYNGTIYINQM
ncbi:MAG: VWA domain-containing protein [Clostridia bacterium]|nr:VWA domain-containing protein [Clostridia bacterium]